MSEALPLPGVEPEHLGGMSLGHVPTTEAPPETLGHEHDLAVDTEPELDPFHSDDGTSAFYADPVELAQYLEDADAAGYHTKAEKEALGQALRGEP